MYNSQFSRSDLEKFLQRLKKADLIALLEQAFDALPVRCASQEQAVTSLWGPA